MTDHDPDPDGEEFVSNFRTNTIEAATQLLVAAAREHEDATHEGEGCPSERLRVLAFVAHALGFPEHLLESKAFLADFRSELNRYEELDAATAVVLLSTDGPLH